MVIIEKRPADHAKELKKILSDCGLYEELDELRYLWLFDSRGADASFVSKFGTLTISWARRSNSFYYLFSSAPVIVFDLARGVKSGVFCNVLQAKTPNPIFCDFVMKTKFYDL